MTFPPDDAPYARLTPHRMLDALAAAGLPVTGGLMQLNSYENRVVQAALEDGAAVVAKFYRPHRWSDAQILEEHAFARELEADDLPVAAPIALDASGEAAGLSLSGDPPTLGHWALAAEGEDEAGAPPASYRFAVAPRRAGRAPELESQDTLAWIGRLLGRMHNVGARRAFVVRRTLDCDSYGTQARRRIEESGLLTPAQSSAWLTVSGHAIEAARRSFDDACMGPAIQDLWMLLSGGREAMQVQLSHVLNGYRAFMDFNPAELGLVEALRTLRMIHHSAWIADRWNDPAFPAAFPWFGTPAYWDQQTGQLREQLEHMALPALACW